MCIKQPFHKLISKSYQYQNVTITNKLSPFLNKISVHKARISAHFCQITHIPVPSFELLAELYMLTRDFGLHQ